MLVGLELIVATVNLRSQAITALRALYHALKNRRASVCLKVTLPCFRGTFDVLCRLSLLQVWAETPEKPCYIRFGVSHLSWLLPRGCSLRLPTIVSAFPMLTTGTLPDNGDKSPETPLSTMILAELKTSAL